MNLQPHYRFYRARMPRGLDLSALLDLVCRFKGVPISIVQSPVRDRPVADVRHIFAYLAYVYTAYPLREIAAEFGCTDHSTAISGRDKIAGFLRYDKRMRSEIDEITALVKASFLVRRRKRPGSCFVAFGSN